MKTIMDIADFQLKLLGTLEFDEVLAATAGIFQNLWSPHAVAILVWDPDLEVFSDTQLFGGSKEETAHLAAAYAERSASEAGFEQLGAEQFDSALPAHLLPVTAYRIEHKGELAAVILACGATITEAELTDKLRPFPLGLALANGWELREIKRENERLRSRYDDLEDRNSDLEEKTRKLIQDLTVKDALRTRTLEREKLIYEISSAVRSSVEIQQVLQNAVNSLGRKFDLSRCVFLRMAPNSDQVLLVYEYHNESTVPLKELFYSDAGRKFMQTAMAKAGMCDLGDTTAEALGFDNNFLKQFNYLSALLVPVIMRDNVIGQLFLQDCKVMRPWSIDDMTFIGALADQLSVAIENADLHEEKKQQAVTDGLTGISNRRNFNEVFIKEFERARRYAEPLSLAVIDLDYLKKINDTWGHTVGDDAIKAIAGVLSNSSRSIDLAARYGGEEFCLLLPNTLLEESVLIAERIRKLISEAPIEGPGNVTASIGLANFPLHAADPEDLFEKADEALYAAKQKGRNRVYVFDEGPNGHQV